MIFSSDKNKQSHGDGIFHEQFTPEEEGRYLELQRMAMDFARSGEGEELGKMIDHGLPVNLADEKGNTLLMLASYHDQVVTVKLLLDKGARVDQRNCRGQTPLSGAIFKGFFQVVKLLVGAGADLEKVVGEGRTATQLAAFFGRQEIIEYLRERGAQEKPLFGVGLNRVSRWSQRIQRVLRAFHWVSRPLSKAESSEKNIGKK